MHTNDRKNKTLYVDTIMEMLALTGVPDGTRVDTARYSTSHAVGDGSGGEYVYDADSTATIDGGFVMPGVGGSLSFSGTTFNGTAGAGRWLLKDTTQVCLQQFGDNLQMAINSAGTANAKLIVTGLIEVSSTISIPAKYGGVIQGLGATTNNVESTATPRSFSAFVWQGADGGTMFECSSNASVFRDVSFWGRYQTDGTRAGKGLHVLSESGVGSGHTLLDGSIAFCDMDVCVECAEAVGESNASDMQFGNVRFTRCKKGLLVNNSQGLNYIFGFVSASQVEDDVFHFAAGGMLDVRYFYGSYINRVLRVAGNGSATGNNTGEFVIHSLNLDGNQWGNFGGSRPAGAVNNVPQWAKIDSTAGSVRHVRIVGGRIHAQTAERNCALIESKGYSVVEVENVYNITSNTFESQSVASDNTTDVFTSSGDHGLSDGDPVKFSASASPSGISQSTVYYVINSTSGTFQVSATRGGVAVDFTTDGTSVLVHRVYGLAEIEGHTAGQCAVAFRRCQFASTSILVVDKIGANPGNASYSFFENRNSTGGLQVDSGDF